MSGMTFTIAQDPAPGKPYTPQQREALRDWAAWTGLLILSIMLFVGFVLIMLGRERRQILLPLSSRGRKPKKAPRPDGWGEAGKRLDIRELGSADDDTVDIDPDELGPGDVEEGPDKPPFKGGPNQ